jgi:hypothetical protein
MSIVLPFPKQPRPQRLPGEHEAREQSAEILFFTGVRIERHVEDDRQSPQPRRGAGKRQRKA